MPDRPIRRLAAIVAADVADYSRLVGLDEEGVLAAFQSARREVVDPLIHEYGGRIANTAGDSLLIEFPSVVDAVRCAVAVQDGMAARQTETPDSQRLLFRIGLHLGDVVAVGDDLLGDGVNIAARLEGLADRGGMAISDDAYRQVRGRLDLNWRDAGEQALKNIAEPIRVWRWLRDEPDSVSPSASVSRKPDTPSIAILPFENRSADPEQEYFSDGIAADIIAALSRHRWLMVIARNSSFSFKGRTASETEVGRELGVRYVLQGDVRKAGNRVRVAARLVEVETGRHVWAERFDRELVDIFDLQDELTEAISAAAGAEVAHSERDLARNKTAPNLNAWDLYQRGMWHFYKMSRDDIAEARRLFEAAKKLAPEFASAHAALGYLAAVEALSGYGDNRAATLEEGLENAERSVALDDRDPFSHFALGRVCTVLGRRDRAILALERSLELDTNYAQACYGLGAAYYWVGNPEKGAPFLDRAIRLSPRDPHLWSFHYIRGNARAFMGAIDDAIADQKAAIRYKGNEYLPYLSLAFLLGQRAETIEDACQAYDEARRLKPELCESFLRETFGNIHAPFIETYLDGLRQVGLPPL